MIRAVNMLKDLEEIFETASVCSFDQEELTYLSEVLTRLIPDESKWEKIMSEHTDIVKGCVELIISRASGASIDALNLLINISSVDKYASKFLLFDWDMFEFKPDLFWTLFQVMFSADDEIFVQKSINLLCNITRTPPVSVFSDAALNANLNSIKTLLEVIFHIQTENKLIDRDNAAMLVLNLSLDPIFRRYLVDNMYHLNEVTTLIFLNPSDRWKFAIFGLIKNLAKFTEYHPLLLDGENELLSAVLMPLLGEIPYDEDIRDKFPNKLKGVSMVREKCPDIRIILLDTLFLFCATSEGRILMRNFNVYDILKKFSEQDNITDAEYESSLDTIGLLIRTEDEVGCDDLSQLKIPSNIVEQLGGDIKC